MMQDSSYEQLIKVQKKTLDKVLPVALVIVLVLFFFLGVLFIGLVAPIVAMLFAVGLYFIYFSKLNVEYEYVFINTSLDIDVIYNQNKRKPAMQLSLREAECICPKNSSTFKNYKPVQVLDYTTQTGDQNVYAIMINKDQGLSCVLIEPDERAVAHLKSWGLSKFKPF